jgi:hypothetical protein
MRYIRLVILLAICFTALQTSNAQTDHRKFIPGYKSGYLNDFINSDTLATGGRRDSSAIYVLYRDSLYLSRLVIQNVGWKLTIVAQDGTGYRPYICLFPGGTNNLPPGQFVNAKGNVELRNLVITGVYEYGTYDGGDTTYVGGMQGALFDFASSGYSVTIDSCILTNTNGNHVRTSSTPKNVKITNTIFGNMGFLHRSNLGAGKAIDVRAGSIDTLLLQNNTFVNVQDRIVRHYTSTAAIKYFKFDHNTIVNSMSFHGMLSLGKVNSCNITNNLIVDGFALGNDTNYVRQVEFSDSKELDTKGNPRMTWVISEVDSGRTTSYAINNNYYVVSDSGQAFYTQYASEGVTGEGSPLTWNINSKLGADSVNAFKKVSLTLAKTPKLMTTMMRWFRTPIANGGGGKSKDVSKFLWPDDDYDRKRVEYFDDTLDCTYATSNVAYTGAVGSYPAGDLNWFPAKKAAWMINAIEKTDSKATSFALHQNYPNPFNPATKISYSLSSSTQVKLEVFDILGAKIATLVNQNQTAGTYKVDFDGSKLSSGMYIYQLSTPNQVLTKKMMLLK